ncbi:hypothetical protein CERSUDRAFT_114542, partial [Gelatoporia subvermispora B]
MFIAMYPPEPAPLPEPVDDFPTDPGRASPTKLLARQHPALLLSPKPPAVEAARNLLFAFAHSSSPEVLFRALPRIAESGGADGDSFIAREAERITEAKSIWEILREKFVQRRTDGAPSTTERRSRRRAADDDRELDDQGSSISGPVGSHSWPILEWLLVIMEKDERQMQDADNPLYSPLLLSQISPPKYNRSARWDVDAPLDIVFHALQACGPSRRRLGLRLLTLLVNLTSTTLLDYATFLNAVSDRVLSLPLDDLTALFGALPASRPALHFKLALCKRYLSRSFGKDADKSRARPKPLQKGQPRPANTRVRQPAGDTSVPAGPTDNTYASPSGGTEPNSNIRQYMPTSTVEIMRLVLGSQPSSESIARMKTELVLVYYLLQNQATNEEKDPEWQDMLRSGKLAEVFGQDIAHVNGGVGPG